MSGPANVLADLPALTVEGVTIRHNAARWQVKTNRHRETDGASWGWIEGAPGNVCWSNSSRFNSSAAGEAVKLHHEWLEAQKSPDVRYIEAKEREAKAQSEYDEAKRRLEIATQKLEACLNATGRAAIAKFGGAA